MSDPFEVHAGGSPADQFIRTPVKRGKWGWYDIPDFTTGKARLWQRSSTFAKLASDTFAINLWGKRMTAYGIGRRRDLFAQAASIMDPEKQKDDLNKIAEQAVEAAEAGSRANIGTALHSLTEQRDFGLSPVVPDFLEQDVEAYSTLLTRYGLATRPEWVERVVPCTQWDVAGTFDRIFELTRPLTITMDTGDEKHIEAGSLLIGDLKTGKDLSYGWQEIEVQLTTYAWGDALWDTDKLVYEPMPKVRTDVALVVWVPATKGTATLFGVDLKAGRKAADLCASVRSHRRLKPRPREVGIASKPSGGLGVVAEAALRKAETRDDVMTAWGEIRNRGYDQNTLKRLAELAKRRHAELDI